MNVLYSLIFWAKSYNGEYTCCKELMDYWAPVPHPETYDGSGSRSFSISYGANSTSFVYVISHCDNGNSSSADLDGRTVASQHGFGTSLYDSFDSYPQSITLNGHTSWSEVDVSFHLVTVGDAPSASGHSQAPGGDFNPRPSALKLSPGWNDYRENQVQPVD